MGWRCETDTSQHHRENIWDYKGRAIYHITLATEGRAPIFGSLTGESEEDAYIAYTSLGEYADATFRGLPDYYKDKGIHIRVLAVRVMPDHMHGIIHVLEPMPKSIGEIVRSFKSACTSWFKRHCYTPTVSTQREATTSAVVSAQREATTSAVVSAQREATHGAVANAQREPSLMQFCRIFATRGSIWEYMSAGYHERILHCDGQLDRMIRYVKDNPRRLWLKHHNAGLFRLRDNLCWTFVDDKGVRHDWRFRAMGNMFLLDFPNKQHIQCSRTIAQDELQRRYQQWMNNALQGVVSISSAISEGEKKVTRLLREAGMPLVVMLRDGFPPVGSPHERYYKPGGVYFDACASGRLLLVEPYEEVLDDPLVVEAVYRRSPIATRQSKRYQFLALNKIGEAMVNFGNNAEEVHKHW